MSSMKSTTDMSEIWMASSTEVTVQSLSDGKILHYREGTNHDFLEGVDDAKPELAAVAESDVLQSELQGRGVRGHPDHVPQGERSQGRGEGQQVGQYCEGSRLFSCGRTGSVLIQLQITGHSSVSLQAASSQVRLQSLLLRYLSTHHLV